MKKMENSRPAIGTRQSDLDKSFKLAVRSLLTTCSNQNFVKAFPRFTRAQQEHLHRIFIQVITSLHASIEDEFESLCLETQVGNALDTVEQLVEEHDLDPFFAQKSNVMDIVSDLSTSKKSEIQYLTDALKRAEEENQLKRDRVELLKAERQNISTMMDAVEKLKSGIGETLK